MRIYKSLKLIIALSLMSSVLIGQMDIGITRVSEPNIPTEGSALIQVVLQNFGQETLQNAVIHTEVNGIPKRPYVYIGPPLAPGARINLYVNTHNFQENGTYVIKSYATNPNGGTDANTANDTVSYTLKGLLDLEDLDAGIEMILAPNQIVDGFSLVRVRLKNFGIDPIDNVRINWRVNGVEQTPYLYVGPQLRTRRTIDLFIGSYNFTEGEIYTISARTEIPNGGTDQKDSNNRAVREYN